MSEQAATDAPVLIEAQGLCKRYGDIPALTDVSFALKKGDVVGFLGPNGAGKSTTMRILVGAIPATSGVVRVAGYDVFEDPIAVKRRVGYLPEIPPVYTDLTVRDELRFAASLKGLTGRAANATIDKNITRCGLEDRVKQLVGSLSKGFRQRVGLAQALLGDPEVLILDEPTVGLDPSQIQGVRALLKELAAEHTILLSTHILGEVAMTCQRVLMIRHGRLVVDDTVDALTAGGAGLEDVFLENAREDAP